MEFDAVLLAPRRAESIANGYWRDRTINDDLDACVVITRGGAAVVAALLKHVRRRRAHLAVDRRQLFCVCFVWQ